MEGYVGFWDSCLKDNLRQSSRWHVCISVCAQGKLQYENIPSFVLIKVYSALYVEYCTYVLSSVSHEFITVLPV